MAWPKGKKRGTKKQQAARKAQVVRKPERKAELNQVRAMGPPPGKGMAFYLERIEGLEFKGHGLYIGICPVCKKKELRVFDEDPVEVRCAKCRFWSYGADQFGRFADKHKAEEDNALQQGEEEREKETQEIVET